jgi:hypothetical protein
LAAAAAARRPFISGNWKLNPQTREEAVELARGIAGAVEQGGPDADYALFVPYPFIEAAMGAAGDKVIVGAEVRFSFLSPLTREGTALLLGCSRCVCFLDSWVLLSCMIPVSSCYRSLRLVSKRKNLISLLP